MADDSGNATIRSNLTLGTNAVKASPVGANIMDATVEVAAAADAGSEYIFFRIPTNARIHGISEIAFDDLQTTGSPTLDIGLKAVASNITSDAAALNDGIDVATAAGTARVIKDAANYGKQAWEFTSETSDPGGLLDVTITVLDAAIDVGGTVSATLVYSID